MKEYWRLLLNANIGKSAWISWSTHKSWATIKETDNYCVLLEDTETDSGNTNIIYISLSAITAVDIYTYA